MLPLRLFLGVDFTWAGLAKLANPHFFSSSYPSSIQDQLARNSPTSPIGPLLRLAAHEPVAVGIVIAVGEVAIGLGTLVGLYARAAATGGTVLSAVFFLATSWHNQPVYQSVDLAILVAWTPFVLGGAGGIASVDGRLNRSPRRRYALRGGGADGRPDPINVDAAAAAIADSPGAARARLSHPGRLRVLRAWTVIGAVLACAAAIIGRLRAG